MMKTEAEFRELIDQSDELFLDVGPFDLAEWGAAEPGTGRRPDIVLQQRGEMAALCAYIVGRGLTSLLEIGFWTGRMARFLQQHTTIERVFGADLMEATAEGHEIHLPHGAIVFAGDSSTEEFVRWRASIGHVGLVFIDGDHSFDGCMADWRNAVVSDCAAIAVHDTTSHFEYTEGVTRAWRQIRGEAEASGLRVVDLSRPFDEVGHDSSVCGIGVVEVL